MFRVENDDTDNPTVDFTTGLATVICCECNTTKANFPLRIAARFIGGGFVLESWIFGCACEQQATVYSLRGPEPMAKILARLAGFPTS